MRQVSKGEFYAAAGPLNVHPRIKGQWPYTCHWVYLDTPHGPLFGKTVDRVEGGLTVTDYFLNDPHLSVSYVPRCRAALSAPKGGQDHG